MKPLLSPRLLVVLAVVIFSVGMRDALAATCTANSDVNSSCNDLSINVDTATINIVSGATVTGTWAVDVGGISLTTLNNAGEISSTNRGINSNSNGTIGTINNTGTIEATSRAIENAFNGTSIGTISNSGVISAATVLNNVLDARVDAINNTGTITAVNRAFYNGSTATIGTISNSGSITSSQYGIYNQSSITAVYNTGTISASTYSIYNQGAGNIGTVSNSGTLGRVYNDGTMGSFYNQGHVSRLSNRQGGATPLDYSGVLPDEYFILIQDTTDYGKLAATSITSKTTFGIDTDSSVEVHTYTSVLSGLSLSNLTSTTGVFGSDYSWTLSETGSGTNIWNLIVSCLSGHTCSGGSGLDILQSVLNQGGGHGTGAAGVLQALTSGSPSGDMSTVANAFSALSGDAEIAQAVDQTLPTLAGGTTTASLQTLNTTSQIVQARQGGLTGLSTGDGMIADRALWLKPFGTWSDQGTKDGVTGYSADTAGLIGGADGELFDSWRVGGALSYAHTNVDGNDARSSVDVDSYQAIGYGSYKVDGLTEANFQAGLGMNRNDSSRRINFGGIDRTAEASYNSYSFNLGAGIGRSYQLDGATSLLPSARVDYTLMHAEDYTESGAGGLNLNVKAQTVDQLVPTLQVKIDRDMGDGLSVSANVGGGYDLLSSRNSVTSSYVGGGAAFVTPGLESSPWVLRSGLGLTYKTDAAYDISIRYDREDRGASFDTQTASIKVRVPF